MLRLGVPRYRFSTCVSFEKLDLSWPAGGLHRGRVVRGGPLISSLKVACSISQPWNFTFHQGRKSSEWRILDRAASHPLKRASWVSSWAGHVDLWADRRVARTPFVNGDVLGDEPLVDALHLVLLGRCVSTHTRWSNYELCGLAVVWGLKHSLALELYFGPDRLPSA